MLAIEYWTDEHFTCIPHKGQQLTAPSPIKATSQEIPPGLLDEKVQHLHLTSAYSKVNIQVLVHTVYSAPYGRGAYNVDLAPAYHCLPMNKEESYQILWGTFVC